MNIFGRLLPFERSLSGKRILVTGNTGFTGSWTCFWLAAIGARVGGFSLPPPTTPALYQALDLAAEVPTTHADIRDHATLRSAIENFEPDLILHLAAQPLVRRSYREPLSTFEINALGTANVLEAARSLRVRGVLCITTDKVYRNNGTTRPYREEDPLGGTDPYSASKAAAELIVQSYAALLAAEQRPVAVASARGGNIVGGGDWSEDRLIPDFVRAVVGGSPLTLRYPKAKRPWQHVLALAQAYLMLLAGLVSDTPARYARSWNFGPCDDREYSVEDILEMMCDHWTRPMLRFMDEPLPEAQNLAIDSSAARRELGWLPPWDTPRAIAATAAWYRDYYRAPGETRAMTLRQLKDWREELLLTMGE